MLNFDPSHTVSTQAISEVIQAAEHFNGGSKALLEALSLDPNLLKSRSHRFSVETLYSVYQYADQLFNLSDIGLIVAKIAYNNALGLQQYLGDACQTVHDYLNLIPSVLTLAGDIGRVRVRVVTQGAKFLSVEWIPMLRSTSMHRYFSDAVLASIILRLNSISVLTIPMVQADFTYSCPDDTTMLARYFGPNINFDQRCSRFLIPYETLKYPICRQTFSLSKAVSEEVEPMFDEGGGDAFIRQLNASIQQLAQR